MEPKYLGEEVIVITPQSSSDKVIGSLGKDSDDYVPTVTVYIVLDLLGHGGWKE